MKTTKPSKAVVIAGLRRMLLATLDLNSFRSDGGTSKAWILPSGKPVMVPLQHYLWLDKNRERVLKEFGLTIPPIAGVAGDVPSRLWALKNGFGRVNFKPSSGNLTIEYNKRFWNAKARDSIVALVKKNAPSIDFIAINILDDDGKLTPASESVNMSMSDDENKPQQIPVVSRYKAAVAVAVAMKRFGKDIENECTPKPDGKPDRWYR